MVREGFELEPAEIALAIEWLRLNPPDEPISLDVAKDMARQAAAAAAGKVAAQSRATQRAAHRPKSVDDAQNDINTSRPTGTSAAAAERRLRKDRLDLHARVPGRAG